MTFPRPVGVHFLVAIASATTKKKETKLLTLLMNSDHKCMKITHLPGLPLNPLPNQLCRSLFTPHHHLHHPDRHRGSRSDLNAI